MISHIGLIHESMRTLFDFGLEEIFECRYLSCLSFIFGVFIV